MREPRVAIIADWLTNLGGAERTTLSIAKLFPQAPIFTSVFDPEKAKSFVGRDVRTSFIQSMPLWKKHQLYSVLRPMAFEGFDLSEFDVVISSCSAESKGIITKPETLHLCYCHTPTRYFWSDAHAYTRRLEFGVLNPIARFAMPRLLSRLRRWDAVASRRVDHFVANSSVTARRIRKYYHRPSTVLHPFVDTRHFVPHPTPRRQYAFTASRLIPYKRIDLAVEASNALGMELVVSGDGPERKRLQKLAGPQVRFVGRTSDDELRDLYQHASVFLFPGEEDFGITPLEAMACGTPVIAFGRGGALETVIEGETGTFFLEQTADSLAGALRRFDPSKISSATCRAHAETFSEPVFRTKWKQLVDERWAAHQQGAWEEGLVWR